LASLLRGPQETVPSAERQPVTNNVKRLRNEKGAQLRAGNPGSIDSTKIFRPWVRRVDDPYH
jgi:hypothetical protein